MRPPPSLARRTPARSAPTRPTGARGHAHPRPLHTRRTDAVRAAATSDPADWERSPEWYGSQGGGWGRHDGRVIYAEESSVGNGRVTVTAHAASVPPLPGAAAAEWRVLRFGGTRQSVALVDVRGPVAAARPDALAFEYVKTVVACAAAVLGALPPVAGGGAGAGRSILCVGVGGGSVPHALAAAFPGAAVTGVELCGAVVGGASAMGLPTGPAAPPNLRVVGGDGVAVLEDAPPRSVDLLIVDAFDGADAVPPALCAPGGAGLVAAAAALHPAHGALVINLHAGRKPGPLEILARGFSGGSQPPTFTVNPDGSGPGAAAVSAARAWAAALSGGGNGGGPAFMAGVRRQANAVAVVGRAGLRGRLDSPDAAAAAARAAAGRAALAFPYDLGDRASYGWWAL